VLRRSRSPRCSIAQRDLNDPAHPLQEDFAHKAGLHRVGYGWIEQCKRTPNLATLVKIASAFDISLSELFSRVDRPRKRKR
jgi:DNA-binding XRE family transcriptional regulator